MISVYSVKVDMDCQSIHVQIMAQFHTRPFCFGNIQIAHKIERISLSSPITIKSYNLITSLFPDDSQELQHKSPCQVPRMAYIPQYIATVKEVTFVSKLSGN